MVVAARPKPDPNAEVDAQIAEARARISHAFASYRRLTSQAQEQIDLWDRKYEARRSGSYRALRQIYRACDFAGRCLASAEKLRSPVYICLDVEAVLAADGLRPHGATIVLDVHEAPFYRVRWSCTDWPVDPFVYALDQAVAGLLALADVATATGKALCEELEKAGVRAILLPDYPLPRPFAEASGVREACHLSSADRLVLLFDRMDAGFSGQAILGALAHLPDNYHMAIIGDCGAPHSGRYERELGDYLTATALDGRVHLLPPVAPELLPTYAGSADIGVIGLDPAHSGERLLLPASLFDCIAARLPVAAGDLPDLHETLNRYGIGSRFERPSPQSIAASLLLLTQAKSRLLPKLDEAARELVWGRNEQAVLELLPETAAVTLLRADPCADEGRTHRIASTLLDHGIEVTIVCARSAEADGASTMRERALPRARFVDFPSDG